VGRPRHTEVRTSLQKANGAAEKTAETKAASFWDAAEVRGTDWRWTGSQLRARRVRLSACHSTSHEADDQTTLIHPASHVVLCPRRPQPTDQTRSWPRYPRGVAQSRRRSTKSFRCNG
jgi:hypothetical protein